MPVQTDGEAVFKQVKTLNEIKVIFSDLSQELGKPDISEKQAQQELQNNGYILKGLAASGQIANQKDAARLTEIAGDFKDIAQAKAFSIAPPLCDEIGPILDRAIESKIGRPH